MAFLWWWVLCCIAILAGMALDSVVKHPDVGTRWIGLVLWVVIFIPMFLMLYKVRS